MGRTQKNCYRAEGGAKSFAVFRVNKSRFYAKKSYFFPILGCARRVLPPWIRPCYKLFSFPIFRLWAYPILGCARRLKWCQESVVRTNFKIYVFGTKKLFRTWVAYIWYSINLIKVHLELCMSIEACIYSHRIHHSHRWGESGGSLPI